MLGASRNSPCPCGSKEKYKNCHGNLKRLDLIDDAFSPMPHQWEFPEDSDQQRISQQGLGRPIVASESNLGVRIVAVGNEIHDASGTQTFHDFLRFYIMSAMGRQWEAEEVEKPHFDQHPILNWRRKLEALENALLKNAGDVINIPWTGAARSYMQLAYDLYALRHNAELQKKLIDRLRHKDQFLGAGYEVQVAAILSRAGFLIDFIDENDRSSRHCEFIATSLSSNKKYSVEAKKNAGARDKSTSHISNALQKAADYDRIVFVDLNMPHRERTVGTPEFVRIALQRLRKFETLDIFAQGLPPAYVFITNTPWEHDLDTLDAGFAVVRDGFKIDEFKLEHQFASLRAEVEAHEKHRDMHDLLISILSHTSVPASFDGGSSPLAFGTSTARPEIGKYYTVPGRHGSYIEGILSSVKVIEVKKTVVCKILTMHGDEVEVERHFSEEELSAWKKNPSFYFKASNPITRFVSRADLYEHFYQRCRRLPQDTLLRLVRGAIMVDEPDALSYEEFLFVCCEQLTESAMMTMGPQPNPPIEPIRRQNNCL